MAELSFDILDASIEELADLKVFQPWPVGTHKAIFDWERVKGENGNPDYPKIIFKYVETLELANTEDKVPEHDSKLVYTFNPITKEGKINEFAQGALKQIISVLAPMSQNTKAAEIMDDTKGAEVILTLKIRSNPKDPDQKNNVIKAIALSE